VHERHGFIFLKIGIIMDFLKITETFMDLNAAWLRDAERWTQYCRSFSDAIGSNGQAMADHTGPSEPSPQGSDDDALLQWVDTMASSSHQIHQVMSRLLTDYVAAAPPELDDETRRRALFWVRQMIEMLKPSNYFWTNPKAVRRFIKSEGQSLLKGYQNWAADRLSPDGLPQLTDKAAFTVGGNLAVTPGQVVFRNSLLEIIQYTPQTPSVWQVPLVLIQPWINKYYIFDLTARNSFVEYLVRQGFTVFITSWKNPCREMGHVTFEDYMLHGALQAIRVAGDICGTKKVHTAGYCIGGTLLASLLGWLAHEKEDSPVADATFFASLLDFSNAGDVKAYVSEDSLQAIERLVATEGILDRRHLSLTFRSLNPGELVWRSMINNYLNGEAPPRSDMLYWNSDSTNLPGAMCNFYLRSFYLENRLAHSNALVLDNRPIDLKRVRLPIYAVGAQKDHICPWQATFQTCRLTGGPVRYVLANEGHITGIVNPPSRWNRKTFWAGQATRRSNAEKWHRAQEPQTGSWWPDWVAWLQPRSGKQNAPPPVGSKKYPPLAPAPGTYVHE
jgi:polyhydroxyalkanoate synthase subunit PhaC